MTPSSSINVCVDFGVVDSTLTIYYYIGCMCGAKRKIQKEKHVFLREVDER